MPMNPNRKSDYHPGPIRSIGILGGGAAGYLTALTLRHHLPGCQVTLIESSGIPGLIVGESTTDHVLSLLHDTLGISAEEFFQEVRPTWKLGVRFHWGQPGAAPFYYGFVEPGVLEGHLLKGDVNLNLSTMLMDAGKSLLNKEPGTDGRYQVAPQLRNMIYGYQFDNTAFVRFLKKKALASGVVHLDTVIEESVPDSKGEELSHLITEDGQRLVYDLYVDCSGFRSELMGKAMQSPYISYEKNFYTDTAVVAAVPHQGTMEPVTSLHTMDHGWQWDIPLEHDLRVGYVFGSDFCTEEEAVAELERKYPQMGPTSTVRFRCGRHQDFWKGNVVAIGNAYGFAEPMQGVALQLIIMQIRAMVNHLPVGDADWADPKTLNEIVGGQLDHARYMLAMQFKYNYLRDTPFWRHCRAETDLGYLRPLLEFFRERGPFSELPQQVQDFMLHPGKCQGILHNLSADLSMIGLGILPPDPIPGPALEERHRRFQTNLVNWQKIVEDTLPYDEAMRVAFREPELIDWDSLIICLMPLGISEEHRKVQIS